VTGGGQGAPGRGGTGGLDGRLDALAGVRVLVVGDVMLDRFVAGGVARVSPEAPVPVLRVESDRTGLGGAGNVLRNVTALGAVGTLVAVTGEDPAAGEVERLVAAEGAADSRLFREPGRTTTIKERYIAEGRQLLRVDRESPHDVPRATARALVESVRAALAAAAALVISDYGKGALPGDLPAELIGLARAAGKLVVVDPKGADFARYRGAGLVTPNRRELERASGLEAGDDRAVEAACRRLIARCGLGGMVATRGEAGMTLVERDGPACHLRAEAREVFDVTGAGDTVVAVLGAALGAGIDSLDAARLANVAAGLVVGRLGTAVVRPDELRRALLAPDAKVVPRETLVEVATAWRRAGLRVGFTNGCFDLLHPGHLALLRRARAACDRLIVGLNSDASVRRLKGEGRPLQDEAARAAVLAALADVDRVVVFAEDTPLALIETLRPDVLIKGAEYTLEQVVGAELVRGYGGRVVLAELLPGHSTSRTIERM
jgi:D-beta-D-heptose 7-phosphate kinase/D-beta-D-heptose 1-phosphate adenosyltransferase